MTAEGTKIAKYEKKIVNEGSRKAIFEIFLNKSMKNILTFHHFITKLDDILNFTKTLKEENFSGL